MIYLFSFSFFVLVAALVINLNEIIPYQSEDLPMLEQIEAFMRSSSSDHETWDSFDLAA
jgi:hypothetical protein